MKEHQEEGRDQIVDALNVAGSRMPDGPNVKDSLKNFLNTALLEETHNRTHPGYVDMYLAVGVSVDVFLSGGKVLLDVTSVFIPLTLNHFLKAPRSLVGIRCRLGRQISAQSLPSFGPRSRRNSRPSQLAQFFQFEGWTV